VKATPLNYQTKLEVVKQSGKHGPFSIAPTITLLSCVTWTAVGSNGDTSYKESINPSLPDGISDRS
jgi:hypothetical protein